MFNKLQNSWELAKASWAVLQSDKELLIFPVISAIGSIIVSILFAIPFFTVGLVESARGNDPGVSPLGYVIGFLFYVVLYTVIFFCNTALVGAALIRLQGGDPTVSDGFRIASERLTNIVGYAVIAATVGMILRAISERSGLLGQIVIGLVGFAWNVATFLVVPVLVIENVGPWEAVKRSGSLLRKTWGENIIGNSGISAVTGLIMLAAIFLTIALAAFGASIDSMPFVIAVIIVGVVFMIVLGLVSSALTGIYQAAVYRFAAEGETGGMFAPELVQQAFRPKNKRGL
ncbi:MAG: hypothetical protein IT320_06575 [Anaerolineae bacterium]|nr:hypothetical protein [Anaerolineae bacterium]